MAAVAEQTGPYRWMLRGQDGHRVALQSSGDGSEFQLMEFRPRAAIPSLVTLNKDELTALLRAAGWTVEPPERT